MQQINLYQSATAAEGSGPSLVLIAAIAGVVILGSLGDLANLMWNRHTLGKELREAESSAAKVEEQLATFKKNFKNPELDASLPEKLAARQKENALFAQAMSYVQQQIDTASRGFDDGLQALSDRHQPGVWLTRISLIGGSTRMNLEGATTDAAEVPRYLESLSQSQTFKGQRFAGFTLSRDEQSPDRLKFALNATPGETPNATAKKGARK